MFHDHHGVSRVPKSVENADEALGVPGVESHTRFVENVERVDQPGAQAGRQVHPFGLSTAQSSGRAIEH